MVKVLIARKAAAFAKARRVMAATAAAPGQADEENENLMKIAEDGRVVALLDSETVVGSSHDVRVLHRTHTRCSGGPGRER